MTANYIFLKYSKNIFWNNCTVCIPMPAEFELWTWESQKCGTCHILPCAALSLLQLGLLALHNYSWQSWAVRAASLGSWKIIQSLEGNHSEAFWKLQLKKKNQDSSKRSKIRNKISNGNWCIFKKKVSHSLFFFFRKIDAALPTRLPPGGSKLSIIPSFILHQPIHHFSSPQKLIQRNSKHKLLL